MLFSALVLCVCRDAEVVFFLQLVLFLWLCFGFGVCCVYYRLTFNCVLFGVPCLVVCILYGVLLLLVPCLLYVYLFSLGACLWVLLCFCCMYRLQCVLYRFVSVGAGLFSIVFGFCCVLLLLYGSIDCVGLQVPTRRLVVCQYLWFVASTCCGCRFLRFRFLSFCSFVYSVTVLCSISTNMQAYCWHRFACGYRLSCSVCGVWVPPVPERQTCCSKVKNIELI